jgi:hypothetical protein
MIEGDIYSMGSLIGSPLVRQSVIRGFARKVNMLNFTEQWLFITSRQESKKTDMV